MVTKREYKIPLGKNNVNFTRKNKDVETNSGNTSAIRSGSNKSGSRKKMLFKPTIKRQNLHKKPPGAANAWAAGSNINLSKNKGFLTNTSNTSRGKIPTRIPSLSRHLVSNTANASDKNSRFETSFSPTANQQFRFERTNTQGKLKLNLFSGTDRDTLPPANSERSFAENLDRANSEISILRQELKKKNNELAKLKKISRPNTKTKIPHPQIDANSPSKKSAVSVGRRKPNSRLTTGNRRKPKIAGEMDRSNSQSDEYYETTKMSPTSSYSNSVYSKGIPQIKSSQS